MGVERTGVLGQGSRRGCLGVLEPASQDQNLPKPENLEAKRAKSEIAVMKKHLYFINLFTSVLIMSGIFLFTDSVHRFKQSKAGFRSFLDCV